MSQESGNDHRQKRAILYARVSTDEQARSGYSLAQQLEALREYAAREGYVVLEEVVDPGQSGATLERPGMDRVRDLVAAGGVSLVLAQDRDRFAREPAYHYLLRKEFEEHGCKMRALNDRGDNSPEGELMDGVFDQFAKFERAKTAERTRRGKLRKAREGKVPGNGTPDYGFEFNRARDGYEVNPETMPVVERIFRMVGTERGSIHGVVDTLNREEVRAPNGERWNRTFVRNVILDDVYKSHSCAEVSPLVSPELATRLDPEGRYGVYWYNKVRRENKQVGEVGSGGERVYRKKSKTVPKPREEWIAVPVPDSGIPREIVDTAREAIKDNKKTSSAGSRFWELSAGIARCKECGRALTPFTVKRKKSQKQDFYYRCLGYWQEWKCSNKKHHRADDLEARVEEAVSSLLKDPQKMLSHLEERVEQKSKQNPEREAKAWAERIVELDRKLSRAQDLAIDGLISAADLREKAAGIRAEREAATHKLDALKNAREQIEELKAERQIVLGLYAGALLTGLRHFSPEARHAVYRKRGLKVQVASNGGLEISGTLDANALPSDMEAAKHDFMHMVDEVEKAKTPEQQLKDERIAYAVWAATSRKVEMTTIRPSR